MSYKLQDLIDIEQFQMLQDRLNEIYSFPSAIIDNDGKVLTATAWQDVCIKFHRKHPDCERDCIHSDQYIMEHLHEANPAVSYRCPRGLVDNATPIIIDGVHYGNFFTGQFFLEPPNMDFYRAQAKQFGFDEPTYLEAVQKVPIWSQQQLDNYLFFIKGLIEVISTAGLKKLQEIESREKIEESEERADTILRQMKDGFWMLDENGRILDANESMCQILGYEHGELIRMSVADIEAIDTPDQIRQRIQLIIKEGSANFESKHHRKDGKIIDVDVAVTYLPARSVFFGLHRDITERKQAEAQLRESNEKFRTLIESSPVAMALNDPQQNITYLNQKFIQTFGYTLEDIPTVADWWPRAYPDPIYREKVVREWDEALEIARRRNTDLNLPDYMVTCKDGTVRDIQFGMAQIGDISLVIMQDVTERNRVETELREKTEELERFFTSSLDLLCVASSDGYFLRLNPEWERTLGYPLAELEGMRFLDLVHPDDHKATLATMERLNRQENILHFESRYRCNDGSYRWIEWRAFPFGNLVYAAAHDVTERKRNEEALLRLNEKLELAQSAAGIGVWDWNVLTSAIQWTPKMFELFGLDQYQDTASFESWRRALHPDDASTAEERIMKALDDHTTLVNEYRIIWPNGEVHWISAIGEGQYSEQGKPLRMLGICSDITARKWNEEALQKSEARLMEAQRIAGMGDWEWNIATDHVTWSKGLYAMVQLDENLPAPSYGELANFYTDESLQRLNAAVQTAIATGKPYMLDLEAIRTDGTRLWQTARGEAIYDDSHQMVGLRGTVVDITERKKAEEALSAREAYLRAIFNNVPHLMWLKDTDGRFLAVNDQFARSCGQIDAESMVGKTDLDVWPEELANRYRADDASVMETLKKTTVEEPIIDQDISKWFETFKAPILDQHGRLIGSTGIAQDITARKQAEESIKAALIEKETLLRELYHRTKNNMQVIIALMNIQADMYPDPTLEVILKDLQNRIRSMALVHEKLYQSQNLSRIEMGEYLQELGTLVGSTYDKVAGQVDLIVEADEIHLLIDSAIPLGLIASELISNAYKHAFPQERKGVLKLSIHRIDSEIALTVADNGVGLPPEFDFKRTESLGMQIISMLVMQLRGKAIFNGAQGVSCEIRFKDNLYQERV